VGAVASRHGDVLLAVDRVRNDPAVVAGAVVEVPEHVAALRGERFDPAVRGTHEEETPRRGQDRRARDDLVPLLPGELPGRGITGRDTAVGTRLAGRPGPDPLGGHARLPEGLEGSGVRTGRDRRPTARRG